MTRKIHLVIEARDFEIRAAKDCASRNGEPITLTICDLSGAVPDPNVSPSSEAP